MDAPLFDTHTFHFTRSTAAALKHSQLPERYHGGILNERTPSLIKKGNISWNKPPFVQSGEQVDSRRAVASKAKREGRNCRGGRRYQGVTHKFKAKKKKKKNTVPSFTLSQWATRFTWTWIATCGNALDYMFTWGGLSEGGMWSALTEMLKWFCQVD